MSANFQQKVQAAFEKGFGKWADLATKRTTIVFIVSFVVFLLFGKWQTQADFKLVAHYDALFEWFSNGHEQGEGI